MMTYFRRTSSLRYNRNDFLTKCTTEVVPVCFSAFLKICDSYFQHHIVVSSCHKNRTGSWTARVQLNIRGGVEQSHPADVGTSALINNFMLFSFCLWLVVVHPHIYNPTHKVIRTSDRFQSLNNSETSEHQHLCLFTRCCWWHHRPSLLNHLTLLTLAG